MTSLITRRYISLTIERCFLELLNDLLTSSRSIIPSSIKKQLGNGQDELTDIFLNWKQSTGWNLLSLHYFMTFHKDVSSTSISAHFKGLKVSEDFIWRFRTKFNILPSNDNTTTNNTYLDKYHHYFCILYDYFKPEGRICSSIGDDHSTIDCTSICCPLKIGKKAPPLFSKIGLTYADELTKALQFIIRRVLFCTKDIFFEREEKYVFNMIRTSMDPEWEIIFKVDPEYHLRDELDIQPTASDYTRDVCKSMDLAYAVIMEQCVPFLIMQLRYIFLPSFKHFLSQGETESNYEYRKRIVKITMNGIIKRCRVLVELINKTAVADVIRPLLKCLYFINDPCYIFKKDDFLAFVNSMDIIVKYLKDCELFINIVKSYVNQIQGLNNDDTLYTADHRLVFPLEVGDDEDDETPSLARIHELCSKIRTVCGNYRNIVVQTKSKQEIKCFKFEVLTADVSIETLSSSSSSLSSPPPLQNKSTKNKNKKKRKKKATKRKMRREKDIVEDHDQQNIDDNHTADDEILDCPNYTASEDTADLGEHDQKDDYEHVDQNEIQNDVHDDEIQNDVLDDEIQNDVHDDEIQNDVLDDEIQNDIQNYVQTHDDEIQHDVQEQNDEVKNDVREKERHGQDYDEEDKQVIQNNAEVDLGDFIQVKYKNRSAAKRNNKKYYGRNRNRRERTPSKDTGSQNNNVHINKSIELIKDTDSQRIQDGSLLSVALQTDHSVADSSHDWHPETATENYLNTKNINNGSFAARTGAGGLYEVSSTRIDHDIDVVVEKQGDMDSQKKIQDVSFADRTDVVDIEKQGDVDTQKQKIHDVSFADRTGAVGLHKPSSIRIDHNISTLDEGIIIQELKDNPPPASTESTSNEYYHLLFVEEIFMEYCRHYMYDPATIFIPLHEQEQYLCNYSSFLHFQEKCFFSIQCHLLAILPPLLIGEFYNRKLDMQYIHLKLRECIVKCLRR